MIAACATCGGFPGAVTPAAPALHGFGSPARCDCPVEPREATEAEEAAAFDEAESIGALPSFVLAKRVLVARVPLGPFLEEVEQRARVERLLCVRNKGTGGLPGNWLSVYPLGPDRRNELSISIFGKGSWILSLQVQGSPGTPTDEDRENPDRALDLGAMGAHLARVLMGAHLRTPRVSYLEALPSDEIPF
jgi:hypothetical protein